LPHFIAYSGDPASKTIAGYVFWTTELEPLERGYDGPIKMLVGVDLKATLTGVLVTEHREPYGYFSVDLPPFSQQFKAKDIRDPFKVGGDIDAISRATITITSSARAVRNGSRRLARALLTPPGATK
jgi:Na+-translocating ferredoxin:NAD+ oxidoreductase RnfG subunit